MAGILIGPYCLDLVPQRIIDGTDFLSDIALAFIAFSTGEFFKLSVLKKSGMRVVWITLFEAVLASVFVFILTYFVLRLELAFSGVKLPVLSAAAVVGMSTISGNSILFSSRNQIKGLTTSAGLWCCFAVCRGSRCWKSTSRTARTTLRCIWS